MCVSVVLPDSSAERAGLSEGDLIVSVSGRDMLHNSAEAAEEIVKQLRGTVATIVIGRVTPTPLNEQERSEALQVVENKVGLTPSLCFLRHFLTPSFFSLASPTLAALVRQD